MATLYLQNRWYWLSFPLADWLAGCSWLCISTGGIDCVCSCQFFSVLHLHELLWVSTFLSVFGYVSSHEGLSCSFIGRLLGYTVCMYVCVWCLRFTTLTVDVLINGEENQFQIPIRVFSPIWEIKQKKKNVRVSVRYITMSRDGGAVDTPLIIILMKAPETTLHNEPTLRQPRNLLQQLQRYFLPWSRQRNSSRPWHLFILL